jgi:hypothetical protein
MTDGKALRGSAVTSVVSHQSSVVTLQYCYDPSVLQVQYSKESTMAKVTLVVPEAPVPEAAVMAQQRKAGRSGVRLGILDNSKGNADHLLRFIAEGVKAAVPVASVVMERKGSVSLPAPADVLDRLTAEADFVVSAMAD